MGKMKALWQAEQERLGLDFEDDSAEVSAMREEFNNQLKSEIVRDEYDLWTTHDGQGDN